MSAGTGRSIKRVQAAHGLTETQLSLDPIDLFPDAGVMQLDRSREEAQE